MLSFLWIIRSWLLDCTAHGVPKVVSSANFNRKVFWLFAVVVSTICFVYQITDMFKDVYKYPVTVNVQIKYPHEMQLPTVTICNSNKLKESMLLQYNRSSHLYKMIEFETLNSVGITEIQETLRAQISGVGFDSQGSRKDTTSIGDTPINERCESSYVVDWNDDSSIARRLIKVRFLYKNLKYKVRQSCCISNRLQNIHYGSKKRRTVEN